MADVARPRSNRIVDREGNAVLEWADFFEQIEEDNALQKLKAYTVAQLNAMAAAGKISGFPMVLCTNESGGSVPVFWTGTQWRRVTDRAVVT
jgi:hypothetical protein